MEYSPYSIDENLIKFMRDIAKIPAISEEKTLELFTDRDNPESIKILIESNLKFVLHTVKKYRSVTDPDFSDLVSEGITGLKIAVTRFTPEKGFKFSTYSFFWIRKYVLMYLNVLKKEESHTELDSLYCTPEKSTKEPLLNEAFQVLTAQESLFMRMKYGLIIKDKKTSALLNYFYKSDELVEKGELILEKMTKKMKNIVPKKNWPRYSRKLSE